MITHRGVNPKVTLPGSAQTRGLSRHVSTAKFVKDHAVYVGLFCRFGQGFDTPVSNSTYLWQLENYDMLLMNRGSPVCGGTQAWLMI